MKVYRRSIILCFWLCLVCFIFLFVDQIDLLSKLDVITNNSEMYITFMPLTRNILLGIFGSSFVVLLTYMGAYSLEKRKTIGLVVYYCRQYILEIANLVPRLVEIQGAERMRYNMQKVKDTIESSGEVYLSLDRLLKIHNERLLQVEGYFPIRRKNKKNLNVHLLICSLAKINGAIEYCQLAYKLRNNLVFQAERNDIDFNDEEFEKQIKMIIQTDNGPDDYQRFLQLYNEVLKQAKPKTVYNTDYQKKCS